MNRTEAMQKCIELGIADLAYENAEELGDEMFQLWKRSRTFLEGDAIPEDLHQSIQSQSRRLRRASELAQEHAG